MAEGQITLDGSPLGANITAATAGVSDGIADHPEYENIAPAEYGVNGGAIVRASLRPGEIFNFTHWFSHEDARNIIEMAHLAIKREREKVSPFHVWLTDERCKVIDDSPPLYAYLSTSLEARPSGLTTEVYRVYKAIFRNGIPKINKTATEGKELVFEMQIGDPFFAADQLPGPDLVIQNIQTLAENAIGPVAVAEFY